MKTPPEDFIRANTAISAPPHVPEIRLNLADEAHNLWLLTEEELCTLGLPPPFWAFAWAGGQGLARYLLDNPAEVEGRNVLDFATGSGLVAIAAALFDAADVTAADIDPWPLKPDVVFEGGNLGVDPATLIDDLALLTTYRTPENRAFTTTGETSGQPRLPQGWALRYWLSVPI